VTLAPTRALAGARAGNRLRPADAAPAVERRAARAMGSPLRLQVDRAAPPETVDAAWSAVVDEFEATERALSRFRESSEVHRLRLAGGLAERPSRRLVAALSAADRARRVTDGRFDPRILPDLEALGLVPLPVPDGPTEPAGARPDPDARILRRSGRRGPIKTPQPVDFGGIGKGLALRWAARRAESSLAGAAFLLEAGGDIVARGAPAGTGWRIGIEDPASEDDGGGDAMPLAVVELPLRGGAIATSSIRRARWVAGDGRAVHHLIDPRTGEPGGAGLLAVTVAGPDPAWAEIWSKSLFLEGPRGIAGVARARGLAAWWVAETGELEMTAAARAMTIWVACEA
jgi:FAD:protein FMN transferase